MERVRPRSCAARQCSCETYCMIVASNVSSMSLAKQW